MELTLESAVSLGGIVGHLSYLLLVISMLMRSVTGIRLFVIASAIAGITYDWVWLLNPVGVFWESLLILVTVWQVVRTWRADRRARFSSDERGLIERRFAALSPSQARRVIDMGFWSVADPGTILTEEGRPVTHLTYLATGEVRITVAGKMVGLCEEGSFVGEMSVVSGGKASATAEVSGRARLWRIGAETLRKMHDEAPELASAIEHGIAGDMRDKLLAVNARATIGR